MHAHMHTLVCVHTHTALKQYPIPNIGTESRKAVLIVLAAVGHEANYNP